MTTHVIKPKYSGPLSKKFWAAVNRVPRQEGGEGLYDLGCVMQEIEARVLRTLNRKLSRTPNDKA